MGRACRSTKKSIWLDVQSMFSESSVNACGWILSTGWWVLPPGRKATRLTDTHAHGEPRGSVPGLGQRGGHERRASF